MHIRHFNLDIAPNPLKDPKTTWLFFSQTSEYLLTLTLRGRVLLFYFRSFCYQYVYLTAIYWHYSLLKVPQSVVMLWPSASTVSRLVSQDITLDNKCFFSSPATSNPTCQVWLIKKGPTTWRNGSWENTFSPRENIYLSSTSLRAPYLSLYPWST